MSVWLHYHPVCRVVTWPGPVPAGVVEGLIEKGCIIVATSNRAPWELNRHGLHEDLFGHFVENLLQTCQPFELSAEKDYRRHMV